MNPTRLTRLLGMASTSLFGAWLTACTWPGVEPDSPTLPARPEAAPQGQRMAQLGFSGDSGFAVCAAPDCPSVTPKTLAIADPVPVMPAPRPAEEPSQESREIAPPPTVRMAPSSAASAQPTSNEVPEGRPVVVQPPEPRRLTLLFGSNSAELTAAHRAQLRQAIKELRRVDRIVIAGRTDDQGSERLNQALAVSRALAIRHHLLDLAPDLPARIEIDARGRCCYVAANTDEDGRSRNRRVELVYTPPKEKS